MGEEAAAHKPGLGLLYFEAPIPGFQETGPALMLIPNPVRAKFMSELLQGGQSLLDGTFNLVLLLLSSRVCRRRSGMGSRCLYASPTLVTELLCGPGRVPLPLWTVCKMQTLRQNSPRVLSNCGFDGDDSLIYPTPDSCSLSSAGP